MAEMPQVQLSALLPWKNCPIYGPHELSVPPFPSTAPSVHHSPPPEELGKPWEYFSLSWQLGTRCCSWMLPAVLHVPTTFGEPKGAAQSELAAGQGLSCRTGLLLLALAWQGMPGSIPWPLPWSPRRCWKPAGASRVKRNDREGKKNSLKIKNYPSCSPIFCQLCRFLSWVGFSFLCRLQR